MVWLISSGRTRSAGPDLVGLVLLIWFVSRWKHPGAPDPSVSTVRSVAGVDFAAGPVRGRCAVAHPGYCAGVWFFCLCCQVVPRGVAGPWGADIFATGCCGDGSLRYLRLRCCRAWEMPRLHTAGLLPCGRSPADAPRTLSPRPDISGVAQACGFSVCVCGLCHVAWQVHGVPTCLPRGVAAMARCGASDCGVAERDVNAPILRSEGSGRHQQDALLPCPTPHVGGWRPGWPRREERAGPNPISQMVMITGGDDPGPSPVNGGADPGAKNAPGNSSSDGMSVLRQAFGRRPGHVAPGPRYPIRWPRPR